MALQKLVGIGVSPEDLSARGLLSVVLAAKLCINFESHALCGYTKHLVVGFYVKNA